ncbi:MAG: O-methyltransferase [Clostridia bacterium]|nr:O-methyltransferase [Clostridia bacterium]
MCEFKLMFEEIEKSARERYIPVILDESKEELINLVRQIKPKRILEIGTAIGYSGSLMLIEEKGAVLDTIELLEERQSEAKANFEKFGVASRVNSYLGDAMEMIPNIIKGKTYDLVFIDGPKSKYKQYLDLVKDNIAVGGYVFCDNVLFRGMVMNGKKPPHKFRTIVVGLRRFLDYIQNNSDFCTEIKEKGDGIAIIKVLK